MDNTRTDRTAWLLGMEQVIAAEQPRTFALHRIQDVTGVSGEGIVAFGSEYGDGRVTTRWRGDAKSFGIWDTLAEAMAIHGHDGRTEVVWLHDPRADLPLDADLVAHLAPTLQDLPPELAEDVQQRVQRWLVVRDQLAAAADRDGAAPDGQADRR